MTSARILVVDDEPGMVRAVERVLGGTHAVVGSQSSTEALTVAASFQPELAIVDIRMPELDGFELMARLRARMPDLDIILMTGSVDDLDEKLIRALRSPAFYFIQKPFDRELLQTLVERCLELRWRREQHRRHLQRLEMEMAEARAFQQGLLPEREAIVNGVAIACRYTPFSGLGGDLYDYAAAGTGGTALLIADVSGHGVSAAMLTGVVKSAFHAAHVDGHDPLAVVQRVWSGLAAFSLERFVTLFAALVSPAERRLRYVNAGHPAALVCPASGEPVWLDSTGPIISPALPVLWEAGTIPFASGDRVLLYTDGVSDVLGEADVSAATRLESMLRCASGGGGPLLDAILADVHHELGGQPQPDDLTLLTAGVVDHL